MLRLRSSRFSPEITCCYQTGGFPLIFRLYGHPIQDWIATEATLKSLAYPVLPTA
ncbi:MAG: hypothetical protein PHE81_05680 [Atribacterota bacterium]|nr:hypothetical protein [Atribacterota bacterium]MDD4765442.1 hypothetical protein [Atribacterota bacterium]MDD5636054.1 hypothetical protein [Atribacterota bacterium]